MDKARESEPDKRYESVEALHYDVNRFLSGYSTTVENAGFLREAKLFIRRNPAPCIISMFLISVLVIVTIGFIDQIQTSRKEAEEALEKDLMEKATAEKQLDKNADEALFLARRLSEPVYMNPKVFKESIEESERQLEYVIKQKPPMDNISWGKQVWVRFIMQDFKGAMKIIHENPTPRNVHSLVPLVKKYLSNTNSEGCFDTPVMCELIKDMYNSYAYQPKSIIYRMLIYDMYRNRSTEEKIKIIKTLIELKNGLNSVDKINYDPTTEALEISGKNIKALRLMGGDDQKFSFVNYLDPKKLIIKDTKISGFHGLGILNVQVLDILGLSEFKYFQHCKEMNGLQKILVKPNQLTNKQRKLIPNNISIIEKPGS
ncbi:MAG: hypothetical protein MK132_20535 [Lentisphaerales bacterium]|nr:hypothetical protein [Lentisphaerales bacterium]